MARINKTSIQMGAFILLFSIFITALFSGMILLFEHSVEKNTDLSGVIIYSKIDEDMEFAGYDEKPIPPESTNRIRTADFQSEYNKQIFSSLVPFAVAFCLLLFLSSFALWLALRHIYEKRVKQLAHNLNEIGDYDTFAHEVPALNKAYKNIKDRLEAHLKENKRLYAYLSHEQKNAVSVLRSKMELQGHTEYSSSFDSLSDSIDDVLTLSEDYETAAKSEVDVALVCAAVCDNYKKSTGAAIHFLFDENHQTVILAKERWIYRAISNLVDNAVKYGKDKPITVTVAHIHGSVTVKVSDNGAGIPYNQQENIFDHRYRIRELKKDGYGIGLSLVSHVCDLCSGFAYVESSPGNGSIFYLSFPAFRDDVNIQ